MKAVVFTGVGQAALVDRPVPQPGAGEALLRVDAAGICMTDAHIFHGHFAVQPPRILGHEIAGTVEAVGEGVDTGWIGERVGVQPARFCGVCPACRRGAEELCANFQCLGNTHDGGYAEYTVARVEQLVGLGDMPPERAAWLEPLGCVLHGLELAAPLRSPVLISGAGTFGKLFIQVLTRVHRMNVAVVDPNPDRLRQASDMGAAATWAIPRNGPTPDIDSEIAAWSDGGPALLVDTSGQSAAIERLIQWAGPKATILLFGVTPPDAQIAVSPATIFSRELTLTAAAGMTTRAFDAAFQMLRSDVLSLDVLVRRRVGLEAVPLLLPRLPSGKIIITPHEHERGRN